MTLGSLFLVFMWVIGLPGTAVVAGGLGWWAFRNATPNWRLVVLAAAVLISPLVVLGVVFGGEGVASGIINLFSVPSAIVALALGITSYRRRRQAVRKDG